MLGTRGRSVKVDVLEVPEMGAIVQCGRPAEVLTMSVIHSKVNDAVSRSLVSCDVSTKVFLLAIRSRSMPGLHG